MNDETTIEVFATESDFYDRYLEPVPVEPITTI